MDNPFDEILKRLDAVTLKVDGALARDLNTDGLNKFEYILVDEAAEKLGLKKSTLYSYTRDKRIRHYKRGTNIYFKVSELNLYIEKGLVEVAPIRRK